MTECRCGYTEDGRVILRGFCPVHVKPLMGEFEPFVDAWVEEHPGEEPSYGALFAQFLANRIGGTVLGRAEKTGEVVLAIPEDDEAHQGDSTKRTP